MRARGPRNGVWTGLVLGTAAAASISLGACTNNTPLQVLAVTPAEVDSIAVEPRTVDATRVDQIVQFTATAFDASGNVLADAPISWASSDLSVATVNERGVATIYDGGETQVTATYGDATATATLTVTLPLNP